MRGPSSWDPNLVELSCGTNKNERGWKKTVPLHNAGRERISHIIAVKRMPRRFAKEPRLSIVCHSLPE